MPCNKSCDVVQRKPQKLLCRGWRVPTNSAGVEADRIPWKAGCWSALKEQLLQKEKHFLIARHQTPEIDYFSYHFSLSFPFHECGKKAIL